MPITHNKNVTTFSPKLIIYKMLWHIHRNAHIIRIKFNLQRKQCFTKRSSGAFIFGLLILIPLMWFMYVSCGTMHWFKKEKNKKLEVTIIHQTPTAEGISIFFLSLLFSNHWIRFNIENWGGWWTKLKIYSQPLELKLLLHFTRNKY